MSPAPFAGITDRDGRPVHPSTGLCPDCAATVAFVAVLFLLGDGETPAWRTRLADVQRDFRREYERQLDGCRKAHHAHQD